MEFNFKCSGCGANYSLSQGGMSGSTVALEEIGGAGTSGSNDLANWPDAQTLKDKWGIIGFNNHEEASLKLGYDGVISDYTKLKLKILESRDDTSVTPGKKVFYEALRIYTYSIYENLFYGYLISHAPGQNSAFIFGDKCKKFQLDQQYYNHLPSFSSALLNFGNCRDLIFVLVKLVNKRILNNADEYNEIINVRSYSKDNFCRDLRILNSDQLYINTGKEIFQLHRFRNIYEHKFRLLWWRNNADSNNIYYIKRNLYNAILTDDHDAVKIMLFNMLENPQGYENEILNANPSEIISSKEILINIHEKISSFFNNTLKCIDSKI